MKLGLFQRLYNAEVRSRREALGLTQLELAKKVGMSGGAVCAVESLRIATPASLIVQKLALFFGVAPEVRVSRGWTIHLNLSEAICSR